MSGTDFKIHMPLSVWEKSSEDNPMRIGGIVSTDDLDRQQEVVVQDGLDFTPFLTHGWFNDNHGQKTVDVLGYPTDARRVRQGERLPNGQTAASNGWWAEGYLLNTEEGRRVYDLCAALGKSHGDRRLGFSIEGKVTKRDKKNERVIVAAEVRNVAVTHCPVNTSTEMIALAKALSAGAAVTAGDAAASSTESGFALRAESLDGVEYDQNGRPKSKKKKDKDEEMDLVFLTSDRKEDGGQPNVGGWAGTNPHLTKGDNSVDVSPNHVPESMTTTEYVHHWGEALSEFNAKPVDIQMTKSEARVIVAQMKPNLSASEVDAIVENASTMIH